MSLYRLLSWIRIGFSYAYVLSISLGGSEMVEDVRRWVWAVWGTLGFLAFLSGFLSENVATMVVGLAMVFANTTAFLTYHVKSQHRVKRASEIVSLIATLGIIVYGYVLTGSFILEVITLFIVAMGFFAFLVSYLLPRIRSKSNNPS